MRNFFNADAVFASKILLSGKIFILEGQRRAMRSRQMTGAGVRGNGLIPVSSIKWVSSAVAWNKKLEMVRHVEERSVKHAVRWEDF